jgi:hypothetical protein
MALPLNTRERTAALYFLVSHTGKNIFSSNSQIYGKGRKRHEQHRVLYKQAFSFGNSWVVSKAVAKFKEPIAHVLDLH